jgi:hypothetical protein
MIEREQRGHGVELVAEIDGVVVTSLPMHKMEWLPVGMSILTQGLPRRSARNSAALQRNTTLTRLTA